MGARKSIKEYKADIIQTTAELGRLLPSHHDYEPTQARLSRQLTAWAYKLRVSVEVAKNEQTPWTSKELGLVCRPMSLKKDSMIAQKGDYVAYLEDYDQYAGIVVERKTLSDLFGTLMNTGHRKRLYSEIERYQTDDRFSTFYLMAECTYEEFLDYVPAIYVCQWEAIPGAGSGKLIEYLNRYYNIKRIINKNIYKTDKNIFISCVKNIVIELLKNGTATLMIDGVLVDTLYIEKKYGKQNLYQKKGATEAAKIETMNSLENKIQVSFVGSRERAVEKYPGLIRQWCRMNYKSILNIKV